MGESVLGNLRVLLGVSGGIAAYKAAEFDKAVQLLKPLADKNNAVAQEKLGRLYERGKGVPKDFTQAEYWYRKAAEQGDPAAQARLGFMYRIGEGVTRDPIAELPAIQSVPSDLTKAV